MTVRIPRDGKDGRDGRSIVGPRGDPGAPGKDAYELAITRGVFSGTFADWVEWIKGAPGRDGADGLTAYELAVREGFSGTQTEWLESLRGKQGPVGLGKQGARGPEGPMGPMPEHRWEGTSLQFQQGPDGARWGELVNLQGPAGKSGGGVAGAVIQLGNSWFPSGW